MNRGVLQSSPVQQIMAAGNPNWWPIPAARPPSTHHLPTSSSPFSPPLPIHHNNFNFLPPPSHHSPFPFSSPSSWPLNNNNNNHDNFNDNSSHHDQTTPDPWSQQQQQQLFMNGLVAEEERVAAAAAAGLISHFPETLHHQHQHQHQMEQLVKQESNKSCGFVYRNNEFMAAPNSTNSSTTLTATSSPQSCITTFSGNNLMEFSSAAGTAAVSDAPPQAPATADRSSECNSSAVVNGGAVKKAKVQSSANQSTTFKVRKFGDRITALHQLVSPFGKTDTASVLLEAIGYIRFLQSQIEALSIPYLSNGSGNNKRQQLPQSAQGERNCIFPEDPGQLLNDKCLKRKGGPNQEEPKEDLRSRGLCLVPVSCTMDVGRENGADYWAPSLGGFR